MYAVSALSEIIIIIIIIIKEFRDAIKLQYDWEITDTPMLYACVVQFSVDHAMVCQRGGFIIHRHNETARLGRMLRMVCNDVEVEPVPQEITKSWH